MAGDLSGVSVVGLLAIALSLAFLNPGITGNAIGNMSENNSSMIGAALFVLGLAEIIMYSKQKR
jgi:formate/nitrite transporter FocA (FNT family)